jgi:hypothetical protein
MKIVLFVVTLFCLPLSCQVKNYSLLRNDNDYSTYNDKQYTEKIILPKVVHKNIEETINKIIKSIAPFKIDDYYIHKVCVNDSIDIFVLSIESFTISEHQIFVYNLKSNQLVKSNISINAKWSKNNEDGFDIKLNELPNIKIESQNDNAIISFRERVHNGNSYNAVIQKYYNLNLKTLKIALNYCIEAKAVGILDNVIIERIIEGNTVKVYKRDKNNIEQIGSFILSNDMKTIVSKNCIDDYFCSQLVTSSGLDDQTILKEGYLFRY